MNITFIENTWAVFAVDLESLTKGSYKRHWYKEKIRAAANKYKGLIAEDRQVSMFIEIELSNHIKFTKSDVDNMAKPIMDAVKKHVFLGDDDMVRELYVFKKFGDRDRIKIGIKVFREPAFNFNLMPVDSEGYQLNWGNKLEDLAETGGNGL